MSTAHFEVFLACAQSSCTGELYPGIWSYQNFTSYHSGAAFTLGTTTNCNAPSVCGQILLASPLPLAADAGRVCVGKIALLAQATPPSSNGLFYVRLDTGDTGACPHARRAPNPPSA
eukprot:6725745-Prymnesium_polylepis.2